MFEQHRLHVENIGPVHDVDFLESVTARNEARILAQLKAEARLLVPIQGLVHAVFLEWGHLSLSQFQLFPLLFKSCVIRQLRDIFDVDEADFAHLVCNEKASNVVEASSLQVCHFFVRAELMDGTWEGV